MEDLSATNYRLADRVSGLDRNHVQLVLKKLAQIHAASAVYLEQVQFKQIILKALLYISIIFLLL